MLAWATLNYCDATYPAIVGLHSSAPIPPSPVPAGPWPHTDIPTTQMWVPGIVTSNKFTTTVFHHFGQLTLDGHDVGYLIPHITVGPPSIQLPIVIAFSSRAMNFTASTVEANGAGVSTAMPLPMMVCMDPVSPPLAFSFASLASTTFVGLTMGDICAGIAGIVCSIGIDAICGWSDIKDLAGGNTMMQTWKKTLGPERVFTLLNRGKIFYKNFSFSRRWKLYSKQIWKNSALRQEFLEKLILGDDMKKWVVKTTLKPATSASKSIAQDLGDNGELKDGVEITMGVESSPLWGVGAEFKAENVDRGGSYEGDPSASIKYGPGVFQQEHSTKADEPGAEEGGNYFTESAKGYKALLWGPEL